MSSIPGPSVDRPNRKRRRPIEPVEPHDDQFKKQARWRSPAEQTTYTSKLAAALRHVRRNAAASSTAFSRGRAVRETADKILAIAARGRSRWSRAILANRLKNQMKSHRKAAKPTTAKSTPPPVTGSKGAQVKKVAPPLERRARVLGRLVPGCRELSFPNLLEEATDYISALEMQVRVMSALADLLTGAGNSDRRDLT